jgi:hypothetical protein
MLDDLFREAEEDCPNCGGIGVLECRVCEGRGKVLTEIGRFFFRFLNRHIHELKVSQDSNANSETDTGSGGDS